MSAVLGALSAAWVGMPPHLLKDPLKHGPPMLPTCASLLTGLSEVTQVMVKTLLLLPSPRLSCWLLLLLRQKHLKEGGFCFAHFDGGFSPSKGTESVVAEEVVRLWGRQAERNWCWLLVVFLLFPFYSRSRDDALHRCKVGLPCSSKHLWKCPLDIPSGVFSRTPNPEELTWGFTIAPF